MKEQEIIRGCGKNDRRCQNALYKKYFPLMSSIALRYYDSKDDALAGINFGFLKVLQNIEKYNPEFALATWIRRVLVNHFIDEFRKTQRHISTIQLSAEEASEAHVTYNSAALEMDADAVRKLLLELPKVTNAVFNLFAIDGYKHKEIADLLNISEGTSKWHVNAARKALQEKIKNWDNHVSKEKKIKNRTTSLRAGLL